MLGTRPGHRDLTVINISILKFSNHFSLTPLLSIIFFSFESKGSALGGIIAEYRPRFNDIKPNNLPFLRSPQEQHIHERGTLPYFSKL